MHHRYSGLGATSTTQGIMASVGGTVMSVAPYTGPAAPFVLAAGAVTELLAAVGIGGGCGQTCITASQYANQVEPILQQNLKNYQALAAPRGKSVQQAALSVFDQAWTGLVQACSNPALGSAGKRCISDRQAGACTWKDAHGNCWNWFSGYRDPIANDTQTYNDASSVVTGLLPASVTSALVSTGIDPTILLIGGGLLLLVMVL